MSADFSDIRNHHERAVFNAVYTYAERYPAVAGNAELLADVACVALNRMPPRYIRHQVDFVFYLSDRKRLEMDLQLQEAVDYAFGFVQARTVMGARD
jgi:hypothetical protein